MGTTIHYTISIPISKNILKKLEKVRQSCMDIPFEEVGEVRDLIVTKETIETFRRYQEMASIYPDQSSQEIIMKERDAAMEEKGIDPWTVIMIDREDAPKDYHIVELLLLAGEGCESTDLTFQKHKKHWICQGFTKTQCAENFVKCHLLVIKAMDILKENGFNVEVCDEGGYWESRDLSVLSDNINESTSMLKSIFGAFSDTFKDSAIQVTSPIENCKNYMNVKNDDE